MKSKHFLPIIIMVLSCVSISCSDDIYSSGYIKDGNELEVKEDIPFRLSQNNPNPFTIETYISFTTNQNMHYKLEVFTEDWQRVALLLDDTLNTGSHRCRFERQGDKGNELPSGDYYYTLSANGITQVKAMKLVK
ncbi:MAG: hypothetical protein H6696_02990 [Deferribacteres bacterium]|nr:hypothetical protein [candidate division KSB1 bacterium]MCB9500881.1 hypothetical protein [Deferribacteres bacterium]